jgi:hypothetical protein
MCGLDDDGHVKLTGCLCGCCESARSIKLVNAFVSGILFGGGFWIMVGAAIQANVIDSTPLPFQHFLPLVSSMVGFLMTALVDGDLFDPHNEGMWRNPSSPSIGMGIVVAGLLLCCVGLSTSIVVLVTAFENKEDPNFNPPNNIPGVLNVASNSLIFIAAWYYRMSHWPGACSGDDDDYGAF